MNKKELINSGKVKSVLTTDNDSEVIIEFSDDIKEAQRVRRYQDIPYNRLIAFLERFFV